jgi:hypothetical protein
VTASVGLAALVVGAGLYLSVRAPGRSSDRPEAAAVSPPAPVVPGPWSRAGPGPLPPAPDAAVTVVVAVSTALRRHDLLVADHLRQAVVEADERVFARLSFPEPRRVAVRLLNEQHFRQTAQQLAALPARTPELQAGVTISINDAAERTRRAALRELLGPDDAGSFQALEAAEIRRVQRRYRLAWSEELDEQAPLPAGLPARAH